MSRSTKRLFRDAERNVRRQRNEPVALTTETRYRCVVIYNDYRRGSIPGGGFSFSLPDEGKRGWNFAPPLPWRSHGFGLRRLWKCVEPSFPICVEPDTSAKGREIKIYRAAETDRVMAATVAEPPPRLAWRRVAPVDVDSRPPLLSIERTSLFRPFGCIELVATSAIDSAPQFAGLVEPRRRCIST